MEQRQDQSPAQPRTPSPGRVRIRHARGSVAQGHGILYTFGNPTYGNGPFERIGVPTTVPLLLAFLAACLVQLTGGLLLIWLRPSGFVVVPLGMLLSAPFWWGFDLPFAWLSAALVLPVLAAAWAVYWKTSRHPGESRRSSPRY